MLTMYHIQIGMFKMLQELVLPMPAWLEEECPLPKHHHRQCWGLVSYLHEEYLEGWACFPKKYIPMGMEPQ